AAKDSAGRATLEPNTIAVPPTFSTVAKLRTKGVVVLPHLTQSTLPVAVKSINVPFGNSVYVAESESPRADTAEEASRATATQYRNIARNLPGKGHGGATYTLRHPQNKQRREADPFRKMGARRLFRKPLSPEGRGESIRREG